MRRRALPSPPCAHVAPGAAAAAHRTRADDIAPEGPGAKDLARKSRASDAAVGPGHQPGTAAAIAEPSTEQELLSRARALAGWQLAELARIQGVAIPARAAQGKGLAGGLVERALGVVVRPGSEPDFPALGVEVKTIPLSRAGKPRESTFVCSASLQKIAELEWEQSGVFRKLARVLWIPIESEPGLALGERRIGSPRLWSPSDVQQRALRADWEQLAGMLGRGDGELVTAHAGQCLQLRPKAAHARVLGWGLDSGGARVRTPPRAFYLRARFTAEIFASSASPALARA